MSESEPTPARCSRCGAEMPPNAPEGLCPRCVMAMNLDTGEAGPHGTIVVKPAPAPPPPVDEIAKLFPQLEILEALGRGGMGAVYKARQPALDRVVALKVLSPEKKGDPQFASRFQREARALARLHHPNIVTVFEFGEAQGNFYLLMEFVDGLTLRQLFHSRKLSPDEALAIVPKICEALQYAHQQGVVHRDIKPENILIDKQGQVKIADFGIAKLVGQQASAGLTEDQQVIGTPHYMAPEQIEKPQTVDHRADIYSLGVVFYEMLTGELPLGKFAAPSRKVQVDVRLDEVVLHALEKEPARRYQQASDVKSDVETIAGAPAGAGRIPPPPQPIASAAAPATSDKTILPVFLLAFLFGVFGVHRFYVGKIKTGILQLITFGGCGIWASIDWILILCAVFTDAQGRRINRWIHPDNPGGPPPVPPTPEKKPEPAAPGAGSGGRRFGFCWKCLLIPAVLVPLIFFLVAVGRARMHHVGSRKVSDESALTFPLAPGGRFNIENFNGQINITGSTQAEVTVKAIKRGPSKDVVDAVKIDVDSTPDRVSLHTRHPHRFLWGTDYRVKVDYEITVPQDARVQSAQNVTGDVIIIGVSGDVSANTVNGDLTATGAAGNANLSTVNGRITIDLDSLDGSQKVRLSAVNGGIDAKLPKDASVQVSANTVNGDVRSEFPEWASTKQFPVGQNIRGVIRDGHAKLDATVVNGSISLLKSNRRAERLSAANAELAELRTQYTDEHPVVKQKLAEIAALQQAAAPETPAAPRRSVDALPPVVVQTLPVSGAADVEAGETELRVTFSKPMKENSWSWSTAWKDSTPEMLGSPAYDSDHRTCVVKVKLEPGRTYAYWLNSEKFHNFKDWAGNAAVPYLLIFKTRSADPTPASQQN